MALHVMHFLPSSSFRRRLWQGLQRYPSLLSLSLTQRLATTILQMLHDLESGGMAMNFEEDSLLSTAGELARLGGDLDELLLQIEQK